MSEDEKVAIGSSIGVFIFTSSIILFLFIGYLCGLYHQKLIQQPSNSPSANQPTPEYEDIILTTDHEQNQLELNMNVAYASV